MLLCDKIFPWISGIVLVQFPLFAFKTCLHLKRVQLHTLPMEIMIKPSHFQIFSKIGQKFLFSVNNSGMQHGKEPIFSCKYIYQDPLTILWVKLWLGCHYLPKFDRMLCDEIMMMLCDEMRKFSGSCKIMMVWDRGLILILKLRQRFKVYGKLISKSMSKVPEMEFYDEHKKTNWQKSIRLSVTIT